MTTSASMRQFIADLSATRSALEKAILRFQFETGTAIVKQTRHNISRSFGKGQQMSGHPPKSSLTERGYGATARTSGRGGGLFGSVAMEYEGKAISVSVGGPGVPYANAQEHGATIVPRRSRYLTIPYNPKFVGTRAREHQLDFVRNVIVNGEPIGAALILRGAHRGRDGSVFESDVAFVLRRRVTIKPRPYFQPAIDAVTSGTELRARMMTLLGRETMGVTVE